MSYAVQQKFLRWKANRDGVIPEYVKQRLERAGQLGTMMDTFIAGYKMALMDAADKFDDKQFYDSAKLLRSWSRGAEVQ